MNGCGERARGVVCLAWIAGVSAGAATTGAAPLTTVRVATGLSSPVCAGAPAGDPQRLFVVEQDGLIQIVDLQTGVIGDPPFLDISEMVQGGGEQGLLGLAFHPNYADNGYFYVNYTDNQGDTVIARYARSADPDVADEESGHVVLVIEQPFSNHNGGWIGFGPDGFLYIPTGDGGAGCDDGERAQDIEELLGKVLRIDVDGDEFPEEPDRNYAIPASNPYVGLDGRDEIWAIGLRNPWRCGFDRLTGDLYMGDVGQGEIEEIDVLPTGTEGGQNFGWDCMEGTACASISGCGAGGCTCDGPGLVLPIHEYTHSDGYSVIGGYPYRGCRIPGMQGVYFFGDYSARLWSLRYAEGQASEFTDRQSELDPAGSPAIRVVSAFAEDGSGELYILAHWQGEVYRIVPLHDGPADIDANGVIDGADAELLLRAVLTEASSDPALACRSDVDGNGALNGDDIRAWLNSLSAPG